MRALFDVNVLLALFDKEHIHRESAHHWMATHREQGWASCPLTENGFVRIISRPAYPRPIAAEAAAAIFWEQTRLPGHEFWPDSLSIADSEIFDQSRILGPNQVTDIYLLGLAVKHGGRLVTFDRGIPLAAVRGARPENLVVVA
jgi:toxin-antitoxin system PIN domain toxin